MSNQTRRGVEGVRQETATRELRRIAKLCPTGMAQRILEHVKREHRETTEDDRSLVKDVRIRGGVCFPGGMTAEEWRNRLPKSLHGGKRRCVPADELAQELYDRGSIADADSDTVLDRLGKAYDRAKAPAQLPNEKDLLKEAKRMLGQEVKNIVQDLVTSGKKHCESACPAPLETAVLAGVGRRYSLSGAGGSPSGRRSELLRLSRQKGCGTVLRSLSLAKGKAKPAQRAALGADISWLRAQALCARKTR